MKLMMSKKREICFQSFTKMLMIVLLILLTWINQMKKIWSNKSTLNLLFLKKNLIIMTLQWLRCFLTFLKFSSDIDLMDMLTFFCQLINLHSKMLESSLSLTKLTCKLQHWPDHETFLSTWFQTQRFNTKSETQSLQLIFLGLSMMLIQN